MITSRELKYLSADVISKCLNDQFSRQLKDYVNQEWLDPPTLNIEISEISPLVLQIRIREVSGPNLGPPTYLNVKVSEIQ